MKENESSVGRGARAVSACESGTASAAAAATPATIDRLKRLTFPGSSVAALVATPGRGSALPVVHSCVILALVFGADRWEIRPLAPGEVDRVGAVLGLHRLGQGQGFYLVAWEDGEPLGHAYVASTDPPELQDVSVRPEHRRRGVASALTSAAEREAGARGSDRLRLTVSIDNEPARALYRSLGYADAGVPPKRVQGTVQLRTGPIEVDDTLLTWEKRLD
jgi:ribosomal-protein-alanine N-acetyltransferase